MTIIRVGNGWHEEAHDVTIATAAAAGLYTEVRVLDKPGIIKSASALIVDVTVAQNNFVASVGVTLPVGAALTYGVYASEVRARVWQLGAAAQSIIVKIWLLVED
jgi:hypothetical protein